MIDPNRAISIYVFFLLLSPSNAIAQNFEPINLWPLSSRLTQSTVLSIVNGRDGMLWIATLDGLTRFDGNNFTEYHPYTVQDGFIQSSNIVEVLESTSGHIFVATADAGLLEYQEETNSFVSVNLLANSATTSERISTAYADKAGNIWLGYMNGNISFLASDSRKVNFFESPNNNTISSFTESRSGKIYAAAQDGSLYELQINSDRLAATPFTHMCPSKLSNMTELTAISDSQFWVGTAGDGLFKIDKNSGICDQMHLSTMGENNFDRSHIRQIYYFFSTQATWVASDQGLYTIDKAGKITHLHSKNTNLSDNEVISFAAGNNGVLWIGTYTGLNYSVGSAFDSYDTRLNENLHSIVAIDGDDEDLWIARYGGLLHYDQVNQSFSNLNHVGSQMTLTDQKIMSLHVDTKGVWVGYRSSGLDFLSLEGDSKVSFGTDRERKISSDSVSAILTAKNGETLVGTYGGGLNIISTDGSIQAYSVGDDRVIMLYQTQDGTVWLGTESGLFELNLSNRDFSSIDLDNVFLPDQPTPVVWSMAESKNGDLWLGTIHHGMLFWSSHNRRSRDFPSIISLMSPGASVSSIYAIEIDKNNSIWCSTNRGLVRFHPTSASYQIFSKQHGLENTEFDFAVAHNDSKGRLYFGGSHGYIRFDPDQVDYADFPPRVALIQIDLSGNTIKSPGYLSKLKTLQLTHKDRFVKFDFSVLDFLDPDKNQYRYMLEGFDTDWIENGTRNTATYTNLPSGNYTLRAQGANSAGTWNREGVSLNLVVLPPPWLTWWAFGIYFLSGLVLLWMAKRAYDSYVIERRATQMAIVMHEAEERADDEMQEQLELQDDLVKSVYQHNVATLSLVGECMSRQNMYLADSAASEAAASNVKRVEALKVLEECLFYQNEKLAADLKKYTDIIISMLLKDSPVPVETITTINEITPELIPIELASPLALVILELLENSIQHAFEDESPANFIQLVLTSDTAAGQATPRYRLAVQDSGVGIPANIDLDSLETSGLAIIKYLAEKLSATLSIDSNKGTMVTLLIGYE